MKYFLALACILSTFSVKAFSAEPIELTADWVCIARTPVLQRAFSGYGASETEARSSALIKCQRHTLFGCYIARCSQLGGL